MATANGWRSLALLSLPDPLLLSFGVGKRIIYPPRYACLNNMKKILVFSLTYIPFASGAELAVDEITRRLPDISFDLIALRLDASLPRVEKIGNVTVYRVGPSKLGPT